MPSYASYGKLPVNGTKKEFYKAAEVVYTSSVKK